MQIINLDNTRMIELDPDTTKFITVDPDKIYKVTYHSHNTDIVRAVYSLFPYRTQATLTFFDKDNTEALEITTAIYNPIYIYKGELTRYYVSTSPDYMPDEEDIRPTMIRKFSEEEYSSYTVSIDEDTTMIIVDAKGIISKTYIHDNLYTLIRPIRCIMTRKLNTLYFEVEVKESEHITEKRKFSVVIENPVVKIEDLDNGVKKIYINQ